MLVVRGGVDRAVRAPPNTATAKTEEKVEVESPATLAENTDGSSYRKASVEDEYVDAGAESEDEGNELATPGASVAAGPDTKAAAPDAKVDVATEGEKYKYWVHERAVGRFERRFRFPGQVDREHVKASLKEGVLRVVMEKAARKERRILVE